MKNAAHFNDAELKEFKHIININKDAVEFYTSAQEKVNDQSLRKTFGELKDLHIKTIHKLQGALRAQDATAATKSEETLIGTGQRLFGELASKLSSTPNKTLINRLEEAEDRCLHSMEEASTKDFPQDIQRVLIDELANMRKSHDHMKQLKKSCAA
jgi:uncharacterized protein (TIGR02284 family)